MPIPENQIVLNDEQLDWITNRILKEFNNPDEAYINEWKAKIDNAGRVLAFILQKLYPAVRAQIKEFLGIVDTKRIRKSHANKDLKKAWRGERIKLDPADDYNALSKRCYIVTSIPETENDLK